MTEKVPPGSGHDNGADAERLLAENRALRTLLGLGLDEPIPDTGSEVSDPTFYHLILENNPAGVIVHDATGRPLMVNRTLLGMLQYDSFAQVRELAPSDFYATPHEFDRAIASFRELMQGQGSSLVEVYRYRRRDGSVFWGNTAVTVARDRDGHYLYGIVMIVDVSEQKRTEFDLLRSRERLSMYLQQTLVGVIELELDGSIREWNPTAKRIFGYEREEALGRDAVALLAGEQQQRDLRELLEDIEATGEAKNGTLANMHRDGHIIHCEWYVTPLRDTSGEISGVAALCRDITHEHQSRERLQTSERRLAAIVETMPTPLLIRRASDQVIVFANQPFAELAELERDEVVGRVESPLIFPPDELEGILRELARGDAVTHREVNARTRRGTDLELSLSGQQITYGGERAFLLSAVDVGALRRSERELEKLAAVVNASADFIALARLDTRELTYLNEAGRRMCGMGEDESLSGYVVRDFLAAEEREAGAQIVAAMQKGEAWTGELRLRNLTTGSSIPTKFRAFIVSRDRDGHAIAAGIATDLTEIKRAEQERMALQEQIQHAQKMEGLGVLAGGIAHDFNNLLMGILGNTGLMLGQLDEDSTLARYAERVEKSARHAAELTQQMLTYSGKATVHLRSVDLTGLVRDMSDLLHSAVARKATLRFSHSDDLPPVHGDPVQLRQVLMNLVINAADAVELKKGGQGIIEVFTGTRTLDGEEVKALRYREGMRTGEHVMLEVRDSGVGMDSEIMERIFDPFFSTKFAGRGLGMATVYGIVKGHRGGIDVDSSPGRGSTFRLYFPVSEAPPVREAPRHNTDVTMEWQGEGKVLVADDEEAVREVCKAILEMHGLDVLIAEDGKSALELFRSRRDEIRLVLLDMMMPVMSGEETFAEIRKLDPETPVVLTSGFTEEATTGELPQGPDGFIQKPYMPEDLILMVRELLGE